MTAIDLSDPWRYICPHCEATFESYINRRFGHPQRMTEVEPQTPYSHSKYHDREHARFYCEKCSTPLTELYDKKRDERINVGTRYTKYTGSNPKAVQND